MLSMYLLTMLTFGFLVPSDLFGCTRLFRKIHNRAYHTALVPRNVCQPHAQTTWIATRQGETSAREATTPRKKTTASTIETEKRVDVDGTKKNGQPPGSRNTAGRRLPRYYGKLGLDEEQIAQVHRVQWDYAQQVDDLRRQLAAVETERDDALERILSRSQRRGLKRLRGD